MSQSINVSTSPNSLFDAIAALYPRKESEMTLAKFLFNVMVANDVNLARHAFELCALNQSQRWPCGVYYGDINVEEYDMLRLEPYKVNNSWMTQERLVHKMEQAAMKEATHKTYDNVFGLRIQDIVVIPGTQNWVYLVTSKNGGSVSEMTEAQMDDYEGSQIAQAEAVQELSH